jgi:hypothetical protein
MTNPLTEAGGTVVAVAFAVSRPTRSGLLACAFVLGGCSHGGQGLEAVIGLAQIAATALRVAAEVQDPHLIAAGAIPSSELLVGKVTAATAWGEEPVAFQKVRLLAGGAVIAEASTDRAGAFSLFGHAPDGHYELQVVSDTFTGSTAVDLDLWRPRSVAIAASRSPVTSPL